MSIKCNWLGRKRETVEAKTTTWKCCIILDLLRSGWSIVHLETGCHPRLARTDINVDRWSVNKLLNPFPPPGIRGMNVQYKNLGKPLRYETSMTRGDRVSINLICVLHSAHRPASGHVRETAAVWFVKWKENALLNEFKRPIGLILCPCMSSYLSEGYSGLSSVDFIPHAALGPCQIYSYPWQALIWNLERYLQSHLEYWLYGFSIPAQRNSKRPSLGYHKSH